MLNQAVGARECCIRNWLKKCLIRITAINMDHGMLNPDVRQNNLEIGEEHAETCGIKICQIRNSMKEHTDVDRSGCFHELVKEHARSGYWLKNINNRIMT
jgi:hypothetical protein